MWWLCVAFFGQAKVRNLDGLIIAKQIFRFQISMKVVFLMHICKTLQSLKEDVSDLVLREELLAFFHDLVHVLVKVLEHKMQSVFL